MKNKFTIYPMMVFCLLLAFSSCEKDEVVSQEQNQVNTETTDLQTAPRENQQHTIQAIADPALDEFSNSMYTTYYNFFLESELGALNFEGATEKTVEGANFWAIPTFETVDTGDGETPSISKAVLYARQAANNSWYTYVADFSEANFAGGEMTGHIGLRLINSIEYGQVDVNGKLQDGSDVDYIPNIQDVGSWWGCTTGCYKDAKDACSGDPDCNFLCDIADLADGCTLSIGAACAIWCLDQGIAPPTTDPITAQSTNDPYCFD